MEFREAHKKLLGAFLALDPSIRCGPERENQRSRARGVRSDKEILY
jgi:hypothetical protein